MPTRSILSSARLIAGLTLCSRVLGLAREVTLGYLFATSELLSAFRIAFMLPNLARRLFGEGALASSMIPLLTEDIEKRGEDSARLLLGRVVTWLVLMLTGGVLLIETILLTWHAFAPADALSLGAILMPYMVLICAVAVLSGALQVRGRFAAPAAAPVILNTFMLMAAWAGARGFGLHGRPLMSLIAWAVVLAGVGQLALVAVALRRRGFWPRFDLQWRNPRLGRLLAIMGPMILGLSAVQINTLADYLIAYFCITTEGGHTGPAVLGFAQFLYQLPLGVFGIAVATAIYPELSRRGAADDVYGLAGVLVRGLRLSLFIALPAAVGLMFVAKPLVGTLYQHGEFDALDTLRVSQTLVFYSLGLPAYFANHLLTRAFYARQDSATPARIALIMVFVNFAMNLALVFPLQERGLALATSTSAALQSMVLVGILHRRLPGLRFAAFEGSLTRIAIAAILMGGALIGLQLLLHDLWPTAPLAVPLAVSVTGGVIVYAALARLLHLEELGGLLKRGA